MGSTPRGSTVPASYLHSWKIEPEVIPFSPHDVKISLKAFDLLQATSTASFRTVDHTTLPARSPGDTSPSVSQISHNGTTFHEAYDHKPHQGVNQYHKHWQDHHDGRALVVLLLDGISQSIEVPLQTALDLVALNSVNNTSTPMSIMGGCASLSEPTYPRQGLEILEPICRAVRSPFVDPGFNQPMSFSNQEMYNRETDHPGIPFGGHSQAPDAEYGNLINF